ncbi:MAG: M14 family zinc carboxypeptidase [Ignavibacteriaceae bacterium]
MKNDFLSNIEIAYPKYVEKKLNHKRFTNMDILPLIHNAGMDKNLNVKLLGHSIENREIFSLEFGEGATKVLLWSQMHGDEPTATMALFDIFNFLNNKDEFDEFRNLIKQNLKLIFVPMLNPDGAERIVRQNAAGIDLNRDARRLQAPESQILLKLVEDYKPGFAFNLHDQDFRWSVGNSNKIAAISLLSPVFDDNKSINKSRSNAIKLIADLRDEFEKYLPGQIARYKDDYEPRSFGDLISGRNVSTILIESGIDPKDSNKMYYRKINFIMLLSSFYKIINKGYTNRSVDEYFNIPTNGKFMFDLILRNINVKLNDKKFVVDIAINREEFYQDSIRLPKFISNIMDIGDLQVFNGIEEFDCTDLELREGKTLENVDNSLIEIKEKDIKDYLKEGVLFIKLKNQTTGKKITDLPINVLNIEPNYMPDIEINSPANFNLYKNNKIIKHVINGWLCNPSETDKVNNGLVF